MRLLRFIILLSAVVAVPSAARGVSLSSFLDSVIVNHPLIRQEQLRPRIRSARQQGYLAAEDWRLLVNPRYSHVEPVSSSPFAPTRVDRVTLDASIARDIWTTGGGLSFDWRSDYTSQDLPSITIPGPDDSQTISTGAPRLYEHVFTLGYSQPLLKNRGGDLDRVSYELGEFETTIADLEALESIEEFLARLAGEFITWVSLAEQVTIFGERLDLAQQELDHLKKRYDVNLIDRADLLRAENALRNVRQQLVMAQSRRDAQAARLAELAQWPQLTEGEPVYDLFQAEELPDSDSAYAMVESESRELRALRLRHDQLDRQLAAYEQAGLPQLDLNLSVGVQGGDDTFSESITIDDPRWAVGLLFRHPIGAEGAKADMKVTRLRQERVMESEENLLLDLRATLRSLLRRLQDMNDVLELNRQTIESARERWQEEQDLYRQGRGQLVWVIQAQDMEQNARLNYTRNAASYHQMLLEFRELTDQILTGGNSRGW